MSENLSLGEFLAQSQRGMGGGYFGRISGPLPGYIGGPDTFRKQSYLALADTFTATYGKKVWDSMNNRTAFFNAIKKVDWGPTVGWRLRSARITSTQPVSETGALPTIGKSTYVGVYSYPKNIVSTFGVTLKGQAVNALEGGIGNQFAVEQEAASRDHIKEVNKELQSGAAYRVTGGSTTTFTVATTVQDSFHIGDTLGFWDVSATAYEETQGGVVTGVSAGTITVTTMDTAPVAGDIVYIISRNGITSIHDAIAESNMTVGGGKADPNIYNFTGTVDGQATSNRRTAGGYKAAALASYAAGVGRDLTLGLVDSQFQYIRQNGGEPKLIVTGLDQYDKLNQLLQAQQRFGEVTDFVVGVGDERTYPGTRAGFQLATYRGVPILPDPDMPKSVNASGTLLGSDMICLDTDYLEIAVMYPTQYVENRDYFAANALVVRGMFITMMELRAIRPDVNTKLADLN